MTSPEEDALATVVRILEACGVDYMVTGSMASSHHGRPRLTNDVDVVIDPGPDALARLVAALQSTGFYVDPAVAREPWARRRQFNAIRIADASKIDLIVRKDRPFSREELARRQRVRLAGDTEVALATVEDTIVAKLEWARRAGGSEKQLADAAGMLDVHGTRLDHGYVERWATELGVLDLWRQVSAG
jgi:hypothetical protein